MPKLSDYYFFRYSILPTRQISIDFGDQKKVMEPNEILDAFFHNLEHEKKVTGQIKDRKYLLYFFKKVYPTTFICKFAREMSTKRYNEGATDIQKREEKDFPFIYIVIDLKTQLILIQQKSSVFRKVDESSRAFSLFLAMVANLHDYEVKVTEITHEYYFWEYVDTADAIYTLKLSMKSPNYFMFDLRAKEFLNGIKELANNTGLNMELENEAGRLTIRKDNLISNFIKYISAGGGHWTLKIRSATDSVMRTISSKNSIKREKLHSDLEQEQPQKILNVIKTENDYSGQYESKNDN
ncbi:MAG: hypothetical protein AB1374_00845 [Bacillota bacterium]